MGGPRKKYSGCIFPDGASTKQWRKAGELLPAAEDASLAEYAERAELQDGMAILDLGCGWGSNTLFMAERLQAALIVGVSNSHGQREWILGQAKSRGLANVRVVTIDVSKTPLRDTAFEVLRAERPGASGFDRVVSVEMCEHMKNYEVLFKRIAD